MIVVEKFQSSALTQVNLKELAQILSEEFLKNDSGKDEFGQYKLLL